MTVGCVKNRCLDDPGVLWEIALKFLDAVSLDLFLDSDDTRIQSLKHSLLTLSSESLTNKDKLVVYDFFCIKKLIPRTLLWICSFKAHYMLILLTRWWWSVLFGLLPLWYWIILKSHDSIYIINISPWVITRLITLSR